MNPHSLLYLIKRLIKIAYMNTSNKKQPVSGRPRGRPSDMKSGELQSRVLDIAEELFAEQGYAATSVRELAARAGVNPALVHYYFGSKRKLLIAVMDRALLPLAEGISAIKTSGSGRVRDLADLLFNMAAEHPAMPRLITREVMLSSGETKELFAKNYAPRLGGALPELFKKEQGEGRVRQNFDAGAATLILLSLCFFPFIARSIAEPILGIDYTEKGRQAYLDQINELLSEGLTS